VTDYLRRIGRNSGLIRRSFDFIGTFSLVVHTAFLLALPAVTSAQLYKASDQACQARTRCGFAHNRHT